MDPEVVLRELGRIAENPHYFRWNTTSVDHLILVTLGSYGHEARTLAFDILEGFVSWYGRNQYDGYIPNSGFTPMYSRASLNDAIQWLKTYTPDPNKCMAQRLEEFRPFYPVAGRHTSTFNPCQLF